MGKANILFLADTHLGFDLPLRPRIQRRRRGPDFFANYKASLDIALRGEVDCVVHGGDLFYRSRIPAELVFRAFEPLLNVADTGVPVFIVPGNHERSRIPFELLTKHPNVHIFDRPRTFIANLGGIRLAFSGFPFVRDRVRDSFDSILTETGWGEVDADGSFLCVHQSFEGATVGPSDYVFRRGPDVIRGRDIPKGFLAILSGHIHRSQVLEFDLAGHPLAAPIIYPGSIERTSFAEREETKGFFVIEVASDCKSEVSMNSVAFKKLKARPMRVVHLGANEPDLLASMQEKLARLPKDSVVKVVVSGPLAEGSRLPAAKVRELSPASMNVSVVFPDARVRDAERR
jgi:DNA repair exonuclease SbcCD nuclease subunit